MIPDLVFPPVLEKLIACLAKEKQIYLVGGAVRDAILGRESHDLDFVMLEDAGQMARKVANDLKGSFYMLDEERDTARVVFQLGNGFPYTLDFSVFRGRGLEADQIGRDFTINALAINLFEPGELIDPLGGLSDLRAGLLRACSRSSFTDDPVRILRGVRLALSLGFVIFPETMSAMGQAVNKLPRTSPERQRDELFRILEGTQVSPAIRMLDKLGVIRLILPEVDRLKEVTQSSPHTVDVWEHTLLTLTDLEELLDVLVVKANSRAGVSNPAIELAVIKLGSFRKQLSDHFESELTAGRSRRGLLLLAALFHDIGKPVSRQELEGGKVAFHGHDHSGVPIMQKRMEALAFSVAELDYVKTVVKQHLRLHFMVDEGLLLRRRTIYRFFRDAGLVGVDICLLSLADTLATYGNTLPQDKWLAELEVCVTLLEAWWERQNDVIRPVRLLTGFDLQEKLGLKPGPLIGRLLSVLEEAQACGEVADQAEALLFVQNWLEHNADKANVAGRGVEDWRRE
jgi:putative nucleotidyltransferase with HDIG domain